MGAVLNNNGNISYKFKKDNNTNIILVNEEERLEV